MKKKLIKHLSLLLVFCSLFSISVSAHEIFYVEGVSTGTIYTVPLRWNPKSSSKLKLAVYSYLGSTYDPNSSVSAAISRWNYACGSYLTAYSVSSVDSANVYYCIPAVSAWNAATNSATAGAITVLFDTNGTTVNSYSSANTSTRKIRSAVVYLNPNKWSGYTAATQKTTATHEMGHAVCLGHSDDPDYYPLSNSVASLMKVNHEAASTPQNHEIADVIAFYD